jgi:transketolase C-terminal domain/subunit
MTTVREQIQLDRDPTVGAAPEWLVISSGTDTASATEAVRLARAQGMRVNHLTLASLPAPEDVILRSAGGAKHIVVAEGGLGQLADEVRRLLPHIGVVPAGSVSGPVPVELILSRLLHTPRCC